MRAARRTIFVAVMIAAVASFSGCTASPNGEPEGPAPVHEANYLAALAGPGCRSYDEANPAGPASIPGLEVAAFTDAAAASPVLTTLSSAISGAFNPGVNLVETLDGAEFTVFAPVDDAFAALPPETLESLKAPENAEQLSTLLNSHVVPGRILPEDIVGDHTSLSGSTIAVTGGGNRITVDNGMVICGGIPTATAVVYLMDTVLAVPAG